ncbi:hypothetical protein ACEN8I_18655 [Polaromonas sp. CT11-55]|uniref:hypothetical protein n=1 Tax=Polaromonas sp. CT11-55 TaxID=3243045 RepID=UPI0039A68E98
MLAAAQVCITVILAACGATVQLHAPSNDQASQPAPQITASEPAIPPGHRLDKFKLCYELRRPLASPAEKPVKRFSIDVSILVPQDDCLALDANGWLRVVPGQCSSVPAKSACEEKP